LDQQTLSAKLTYDVESRRTHGAILQAVSRLEKLEEQIEQIEQEESWFNEQLEEEKEH
jgi:hypothetical protein